jgi:hypothetical protein
MDAFQLLKADHRKVEELFKRLEAASGQARLRVFEQIKTELELHTHIEEKIFYPALEKPEETHELTLEAYEEHDVVKKLLQELSRAKSADEEWQAQAKVLKENVEHHVQEEEGELFEKAESVLSDEDIEALGERMDAEKARQQGRGATKRASGSKSSKKAAGKSKASKTTSKSKKSGSAAKGTSKSSAKKTAGRSRSKKSGTKKAGSKKSGTKKSGKKSRR